ncbi:MULTISPECIES: hypothetical protein [Bizionia]|uniref:Uncharacterized protein n=1 Tax=Bizionia algoritergicola TaxID=291187 RepID=A0A5D0R1G5_9FLAO|nr:MULTISPECIES: hypothetical protein [Bizionia]OBX21818.1 hypothetical protein BAA08_11240 [Bizionia sp. APA-3]TYB74835.1 hypothetical protein ES675_01485 [Bizionia algoritergicola]
MLSTVFFSCSTEENTISVENTTSLSEQNSFLKQSDEIIAFREALAEFSRSNTLEQKNGKPVSIFNSTNQEQIINQSRILLNTFGFSNAELDKLNNNNLILIKALKVYAEKTKLTY